MVFAPRRSIALLAFVVSFGVASSASADSFGPWDAGDMRSVSRQGRRGLDRHSHPHLGAADKVPGEGPPPPPLRSDPDVPEDALRTVNRIGAALSSNPLFLAAVWYSHLFTQIDGARCHHLPTCSRFAYQAVAKHGLLGIFMALDRIIQPPMSSAIRGLPEVDGYGDHPRGYDPVSNYEFWDKESFSGLPPAADEEPLPLGTDEPENLRQN